MRKILIIDDIRDCYSVFPGTPYHKDDALDFDVDDMIIIARTYSAALTMLNCGIQFDVVFLDHDLGFNADNKTGYDWICEVERRLHTEPLFASMVCPKEIICVSSNPAGKAKIEAAWKNMKETFLKENGLD